MNSNTQFIDKLAITISSLCVAHCLVFPILAVMAPSFITLGLSSENFHFWMIIAVIPSSIYALALGCKQHGEKSIFLTGMLGLSCLLFAFILGADLLSELGEKGITLVGALLIAFSHIRNFKLCKHSTNCGCHGTQNNQ